MIVDITGTILTPGNNGDFCKGNGTFPDAECCCDECDYAMCCLPTHDSKECLTCNDRDCPHAPAQKASF